MEDLLYQIALKNLDGIGSKCAKLLVSYCGWVKEIFETNKKELAKIPKLVKGTFIVSKMNRDIALSKAKTQ